MPTKQFASPASPGKMKWTAEAERDLLLLLVQMYVTKIDYQEVARRMGGVSVEGVSRHIRRIRKDANLKGITGAKGVKRESMDFECEEGEMKMEDS
jgi:predicted transcriptional regulator